MSHLSFLLSFLNRHAGLAQQLNLPGHGTQVLHQDQQVPFEAHVPLERGRPDAVVHRRRYLLAEVAPGLRAGANDELVTLVERPRIDDDLLDLARVHDHLESVLFHIQQERASIELAVRLKLVVFVTRTLELLDPVLGDLYGHRYSLLLAPLLPEALPGMV